MPKNSLFYHLSVPYANIIPGRQEAGGDQLALISKGAAWEDSQRPLTPLPVVAQLQAPFYFS